ncbi:hypothetical protein TNCV_4687951 [Trichonephila clavipes]|nr:hypothetical protein TNCV_4687951 [Trichonephila clavipes]
MNRVVLTEYNGDQISHKMVKFKERSPDRPLRGRHNKEDQFDPENPNEGTIAPKSKKEQDQAARMPDEEVINNAKTRKGEERVRKYFCPWRFR